MTSSFSLSGFGIRDSAFGSLRILTVTVLLLIGACADEGDAGDERIVEEAVCEDGTGVVVDAIDPDIATIGPAANVIRRFGDSLWIVESGSNTVSRMDPETFEIERAFIDVGNERNPYDIFVDGDRAYVTNLLAETLTVADATTGEVIEEVESDLFRKPEGVAASRSRIYVTNSNHTDFNEFGPGSVTVLDRETLEVLGEVPTEAKNPQYAEVIEWKGEELIVISQSGAIVFEEGAVVGSAGAVEIWRETDNPRDPERKVARLPQVDDPRIGAAGRPLHLAGTPRIYFASGTAPVLFELDLETNEWIHGTENPIQLYDRAGDALHHATIGANGVIYVTSFNLDAVFLFDTSCNETLAGPIDLGINEMLEGPHGIALARDGPERDGQQTEETTAVFIKSLSNAAGRLNLNY